MHAPAVAEGTSGRTITTPNGELVIPFHGIGLAPSAGGQAWKDNDYTSIPRRDSFRHGLVFPP